MLSVTERSTGRLFGVCWCAQQHWGHEKSKMRHWEDARQETLVCAQTASCFSLHCVQFSHEKLPKLLRDRRSWTALRCDEPRARLVIVNQRRDAKRMGERERAGLQHTVRCLQEIKGLMGHLQLLVLPRTAVFRLTAERQRETLWLSRFTGPLGYYHALSAWWILSSDQLVSSDLLKPPVSCWIPSRQVWQTEAGQWERLQLWSWVSAGRACVWGQVLLFIFIMMMALTLWCTE